MPSYNMIVNAISTLYKEYPVSVSIRFSLSRLHLESRSSCPWASPVAVCKDSRRASKDARVMLHILPLTREKPTTFLSTCVLCDCVVCSCVAPVMAMCHAEDLICR